MKSSKEIQKKMNNISKALDAKNKTFKESVSKKNYEEHATTHLFSNEFKVSNTISEVQARIKEPDEKENDNIIRFALITGEGSVLSWAPVFKKKRINGIFCADINQGMLQHMQFLYSLFLTEKNPENFTHKFTANHPLLSKKISVHIVEPESIVKTEIPLNPDILNRFLTLTKKHSGDFHFLNSKNYSKNQKIMANIAFGTINYDITNLEQTHFFKTKIQEEFPDSKIEFSIYNISNVYDYCAPSPLCSRKIRVFLPTGDIEKCATTLLSANDSTAIFLYSILGKTAEFLESKFCIGYDKFATNMQHYKILMNNTILQKHPGEKSRMPKEALKMQTFPIEGRSTEKEEKSSLLTGADLLTKTDLGVRLRQASANPKIPADEHYVQLVNSAKNENLIDERSTNGNTALLWAITKGNVDKVKILIAHGANPLLTNSDNNNAYALAKVHRKNAELIPILPIQSNSGNIVDMTSSFTCS